MVRMRRAAIVCLLGRCVFAQQIAFEDVAARAKLDFVLRNAASGNFNQIELMLGGVAAFDLDNDGCTDIYFTNGASIPGLKKDSPAFSNRLYRNRCDMTFEDVTARAGVGGDGYSMAAAAADYDNDGLTDLFVAGVNRNTLYRNLGGGRFADMTEKARLSGVDAERGKMWSVSAGWLDYNNDGLLDLFVVSYVAWSPETEPVCGKGENRFYCHPNAYPNLPNQLFRNNGDGTFTDVSRVSGLAKHLGKGMGHAFADFDRDGFTDIFVANDSVPGFLFRNLGDGTFAEVGLEAGVALRDDGAAIAGMGADFRDYDNDGLPDLIVTGMINDTFLLFRNTGSRLQFEDARMRTGLLLPTRQWTGWSLAMCDFNNDGWKDLFFALSHFPRLDRYIGRNSALPVKVFASQSGRRFVDVSAKAGEGFQAPALHHGSAIADFDNDGRMDIVVSVMNGPARLLRNMSPDANHWLAIKLLGRKSNRDGLGAVVTVTLKDSRTLTNHAQTSYGYASASERLVRFGMGAETRAERIRVRWPSGIEQELQDVRADQILEVEETAP